MRLIEKPFDVVHIFELNRFQDERGFFLETYQEHRYNKYGITENFVQDNQSRSKKNVLRGLHFTVNKPQSQLMTVLKGIVFDVVIDLRKDSKSFGEWRGFIMGGNGPRQIFMPNGFAHGFCVLSEYADLHYKVSKKYDALDEAGILWSDETIGIEWPIKNPLISVRDRKHPKLNDFFKK